MKIGLISDTHGKFDSRILSFLEGVSHVIHAGDVGHRGILDELSALAPVTAVLGNTDRSLDLPHMVRLTLDGVSILVVHTDAEAEALASSAIPRPEIIVHGHTHVPRDQVVSGVRLINPGAVQHGRQGHPRSVAILDLTSAGHPVRWIPLE